MKTRIELLLVEHDVVGASGDSLACRCDGRWRPVADYREHIADALLPLIREAQAEARAQVIADLHWLAGVRAEYDHIPEGGFHSAPPAEQWVNCEHTAVTSVADILEGASDGYGWLPSWRRDEWAIRAAAYRVGEER